MDLILKVFCLVGHRLISWCHFTSV